MGCLKYKAITDTRHKRQWDQIMEIDERFEEKGEQLWVLNARDNVKKLNLLETCKMYEEDIK